MSRRKICFTCKAPIKIKAKLAAEARTAAKQNAKNATVSSPSKPALQPIIVSPPPSSAAAKTKSKIIVRTHASSSVATIAQPAVAPPVVSSSSVALTPPASTAPLSTAASVAPPYLLPSPLVQCYGDFFGLCNDCGSRSDDDSGSCPYCHIPLVPTPCCAACGEMVGPDITPCYSCSSRLKFFPDLPAPPNFVRYVSDVPNMSLGIRHEAHYLGVRTGFTVRTGEIVSYTSSAHEHYTHNGTAYDTFHYELADGRGWIHDFSPAKPGNPTLTRGWVNDTNKPGSTDFSTTVMTKSLP